MPDKTLSQTMRTKSKLCFSCQVNNPAFPRRPYSCMVSVVIPVLNEETSIADVVTFALSEPLVEEVIVVDDASLDASVERAEAAGARVIQSTLLGKGASMFDGVLAARNDCILFLDGDLRGLEPGLVEKLACPVLRGDADFVKASFRRCAGRVTVLTVKPLLQVFFPELAKLSQPIGGIIAARRSLLLQLEFENDYGVDVGLLIDSSLRGARIQEVDIGYIEHDSQGLEALGRMAQQVSRVILERALADNRLDGKLVAEAREAERHLFAGLECQISLHSEAKPIVLLPMDGVLLQGSFIAQLAIHTKRSGELARVRQLRLTREEQLRQMVKIFQGVPRKTVEDLARKVTLQPSALQTVSELRRLGYRVFVLGELFHLAADIIRRRVYADVCISHLTRCRGQEFRIGELMLAPAFQHPQGCERHIVCNSNVMLHLQERYGLAEHEVIAVGMWPQDSCLLRRAGKGYAFNCIEDYLEQGLAGCLDVQLDSLPELCGPAVQLKPNALLAAQESATA
jgi:glucosyl-3-phosphoglycerate synthase